MKAHGTFAHWIRIWSIRSCRDDRITVSYTSAYPLPFSLTFVNISLKETLLFSFVKSGLVLILTPQLDSSLFICLFIYLFLLLFDCSNLAVVPRASTLCTERFIDLYAAPCSSRHTISSHRSVHGEVGSTRRLQHTETQHFKAIQTTLLSGDCFLRAYSC